MTIATFLARVAVPLLMVGASGAWACPGTAPTALSLTLTPGEIRGVYHVLQVNVQTDGCLRVQRPRHWRDAGTWSGPVAAPALRSGAPTALAALVDFDGARVRAELDALEQARGEAFSVEGADRYVLRWVDAAGRSHQAAFDAIFQYAERYPNRADLAAFASLVSALQAEAAREDLVTLEPQS